MDRTYICIDLKSYYASVECVHRGLDPLKANVPEARLAFVANEREAKYFQETLMVVRHQCEKKKVQLAEINLNSAQDIRIAIVQAFARAHIYISSDEKDVSIVRKRFFAWRSR